MAELRPPVTGAESVPPQKSGADRGPTASIMFCRLHQIPCVLCDWCLFFSRAMIDVRRALRYLGEEPRCVQLAMAQIIFNVTYSCPRHRAPGVRIVYIIQLSAVR